MTDICRFLQAPCPGCSHLWHYDVNHEAGLFLAVDQQNFRPIVKQMLAGLNGEVPESLDCSFWFYPSIFTLLKAVLSAYSLVHY